MKKNINGMNLYQLVVVLGLILSGGLVLGNNIQKTNDNKEKIFTVQEDVKVLDAKDDSTNVRVLLMGNNITHMKNKITQIDSTTRMLDEKISKICLTLGVK